MITEGFGAFGVMTTRSSSNISLASREFELELLEETLHLKVLPSGKHPTVPKHPAVPSMHENTEEKRVVLEKLSEEDEHDQTAG